MTNPNFLHHEPNPRRRADTQWTKVIIGTIFILIVLYLLYLFLSPALQLISSFWNYEGV